MPTADPRWNQLGGPTVKLQGFLRRLLVCWSAGVVIFEPQKITSFVASQIGFPPTLASFIPEVSATASSSLVGCRVPKMQVVRHCSQPCDQALDFEGHWISLSIPVPLKRDRSYCMLRSREHSTVDYKKHTLTA